MTDVTTSQGPRADTPPAPLVVAANISKRYGSTIALADAGIVVHAGRTHALVGRNGAGKSTLVSILTGLTRPDSGTIAFSGEPAPALADREGWRRRVACVYQHSTIIGDLSVAENLFINRQDRGKRLINWASLRNEATAILDSWHIDVDVRAEAGSLTVEQRQLMEIARSLSHGARFIILDEPTAQLDGAAIKRLFARIHDLQGQGVTFLFISHHLSEVYEICQDVTVFRDARHIITAPVAELSRNALIEAMTGQQVVAADNADRVVGDRTVLEVTGLSRPGEFSDVSFSIADREILGLAGGGGSGKAEVAETIVGLRKPTAGSIRADGRSPKPGDVRHALASGIGFVPQDRHIQGLVPEMSVADNATLSVPERITRKWLLSRPIRRRIAETAIAELDIRTSGPDQPVAGLSGGNQQKVVMARAMANDPTVLVLISPTAGVDVASKKTLMDAVVGAADGGRSALVVTDEIDDLRVCDRVVVMRRGGIVAEFVRGWDENTLIAAMEGLDQ